MLAPRLLEDAETPTRPNTSCRCETTSICWHHGTEGGKERRKDPHSDFYPRSHIRPRPDRVRPTAVPRLLGSSAPRVLVLSSAPASQPQHRERGGISLGGSDDQRTRLPTDPPSNGLAFQRRSLPRTISVVGGRCSVVGGRCSLVGGLVSSAPHTAVTFGPYTAAPHRGPVPWLCTALHSSSASLCSRALHWPHHRCSPRPCRVRETVREPRYRLTHSGWLRTNPATDPCRG
mmetsp:Transcript_56433/g.155972  ORF Transcript_56433/g.155972 Transcript_56433/m.155972 type:complete len:232 (+) Transcript_56433:265-960(+)